MCACMFVYVQTELQTHVSEINLTLSCALCLYMLIDVLGNTDKNNNAPQLFSKTLLPH